MYIKKQREIEKKRGRDRRVEEAREKAGKGFETKGGHLYRGVGESLDLLSYHNCVVYIH